MEVWPKRVNVLILNGASERGRNNIPSISVCGDVVAAPFLKVGPSRL